MCLLTVVMLTGGEPSRRSLQTAPVTDGSAREYRESTIVLQAQYLWQTLPWCSCSTPPRLKRQASQLTGMTGCSSSLQSVLSRVTRVRLNLCRMVLYVQTMKVRSSWCIAMHKIPCLPTVWPQLSALQVAFKTARAWSF